MGRGKVQLKRIEDKISRQVTFSKRKGGLMKKANELAVLCDVEVALLIFSDRGRLYEFCSAESLEEILERYRIHVDEEAAVCRRAELEKNLPECTDLRTSANPLQMIQRHLDAQNIEQKNITELTELEKELDAILRQTRYRKTQLLMEAAKAVQEGEKQPRKEKTFMEEEVAEMSENLDNHYNRPLEPESNSNSNDPPLSPLQETLLHLF
ncbi:truncated transcription factor CAULIFLOWER A-like isoform X2 [Corylus avellana]|uniref:truncated transcription factor CAULIFLOWER A-like isoform X2 n=1 Tax=Corylus avellana TaxID=13451 RepID=UPI00286C0BFD|nr:truncated transcription factor CAULIFLOWER A-like isoform X2 [Corylus avellana]